MGELAGVPVDAKQVERTAEALGRAIAQDERTGTPASSPISALPSAKLTARRPGPPCA